ncbi:hypothetical protein GCM10010341_32500 [Streptomyces noursei]|nr:hypothetical protein GCM10010341_32500 [Streptomyces noursei]
MGKPDITEVFRHYYPEVALTARGGWQKIHCPEHVESNPSASVSSFKNRWTCFACDIHEDSWDLIMRKENCGYRAAQEFTQGRFSGGDSPGIQPGLPGKPGRGVHGPPRFGQLGDSTGAGVRRFPRYGA